MSRDPALKSGELPREAQNLLRNAARVGQPGSLRRAAEINKAYRIIEENYPEYLRTGE